MKIYLAGPMRYCTTTEITEWRNLVKYNLKNFEFFDPSLKTKHKSSVKRDLYMIKKSDIVVANCWKDSVGTSMEIIHSFFNFKVVIVICKEINISSWIEEHCHFIFETIEEFLSFMWSNHYDL